MSQVQLSLPQLTNTDSEAPEEGTAAYYESVAARIVARRRAARRHIRSASAQKPHEELGELIALPPRQSDDPELRVEPQVGSEFPVCVASHRQVNDSYIEVKVGGHTHWRLERVAASLLPGPEHYAYWVWFLDRCHAAASVGCTKAPRIIIRPSEICRTLGTARCAKTLDEAFKRFSRLVIDARHIGGQNSTHSGALGTLCYYMASSDETNCEQVAWVAPGLVLWSSILHGNAQPLSVQQLRSVHSYTARRLLAHLGQRCRPGETHVASLEQLAQKIPLRAPPSEVARRLAPHHAALVNCGFLAELPRVWGDDGRRRVSYRRAK